MTVLDFTFDDFEQQRPGWPERSLRSEYERQVPYEFALLIQDVLGGRPGSGRPKLGVAQGGVRGYTVRLMRGQKKISTLSYGGQTAEGFPKVRIRMWGVRSGPWRLLGYSPEIVTSDLDEAVQYVDTILALLTAPGAATGR